jgi:nitric oxide reductase NorD protein
VPTLDLDWELGAFRALRAFWRWARPASAPGLRPEAALLADSQARLELIARFAGGVPVIVRPGAGLGGLRGLDLLLPEAIDRGPTVEVNWGLYVLRAVLGGVMAAQAPVVPRAPPARYAEELRRVAAALAQLRSELPGFGAAWTEAAALERATRPPLLAGGEAAEAALYAVLAGEGPPSGAAWMSDTIPAPTLLWGRLMASTHDHTAETADPGAPGEAARPPRPQTEHEAPPVEDLRRVQLDPRGQEKTLQHNFEKVETADSWEGNALKADGADELDDELEALEEVKLGDLVRGGPEAHAMLRAEVGGGEGVPDVGHIGADEQGLAYPEWDQRGLRYREGWCTVYPAAVWASDPTRALSALADERARVRRLVERLLGLRAARRMADRQRDGDHPDVDALTCRQAELRAGRAGDERLYLRAVPRRRALQTTALLDLSLSADAWQGGRRVLDAARSAALVLGEAAHQLGDPLELLAFASHTRHRCRVWSLKGADEPWPAARGRLFALEPQGYTRIGAALRHAVAGLAARPAEARLLLLIGDGKPTDHDRYEGAHGIADVRRAVGEAAAKGVEVHALALDPSARSLLPQMFGAERWHLITDLDALPEVLGGLYARLAARAGV